MKKTMGRIKILFWRIVLVIAVLNFSLFWIGNIKSLFEPHVRKGGKPIHYERKRLVYSEITDFIVVNDKIYVLYDDKEVIQAYDLMGRYLFSLALYMQEKGRGSLATDGNYLYVQDRDYNYYAFSQQGEFICFYKYKEEEAISDLKKTFKPAESYKYDKNANKYELKGASIVKITAEGEIEKIVNRPFWMAVFQNARTGIITFGCGILVCIKLEVDKRKTKKRRDLKIRMYRNNKDDF